MTNGWTAAPGVALGALALALGVGAPPAQAVGDAAGRSASGASAVRVGGYAGVEYFRWEEISPGGGQILDETGPRFTAGVTLDNYGRSTSGVIFGADLGAYVGEVDYDGETLLTGRPLTSRTEYTGTRAEGVLGLRSTEIFEYYHSDAFVGLGVDAWEREIQSGPTREDWRVIYGKLGLGFSYVPRGEWSTRLQLGVKHPLDVDEDAVSLGIDGLEPGGDTSLFVTFDLRPARGPGPGLQVYYDSYRFERSGARASPLFAPPDNQFFQPESDQDTFGVRVTYHFN